MCDNLASPTLPPPAACSDHKLLPKIEAAAEAAQSASATVCLVKFYLLLVGAAA